MYEVWTREIPDRSLLCVKRNVVGVDRAWAFGKEFIVLLGTTSSRRYRDAPARSSASSGGRSARTATV